MKSWFYPLNEGLFHFEKALSVGLGTMDIRDSYGFEVGDRVYVLSPSPYNLIKYEMEVIQNNIRFEDSLDEERFWKDPDSYYDGLIRSSYSRLKVLREFHDDELNAENLKRRGLRSTISVDILPADVLSFILTPTALGETFGVEYPDENDFYEGALIEVKVNKYERSRSARDECIEKKGCRCIVCKMDFGEKYGSIGKGFIHVHHLVPISTIGKEYQLDVERDLVPVCPNCHYMLHRKPGGGVYTIEELKRILSECEQ